MKDEEVGELWREKYKYRNSSMQAVAILTLIRKLVKERAQFNCLALGHCEWNECDAQKFHYRQACRQFGIPWEEFNEPR